MPVSRTFQLARNIAQNEGLVAFWKGTVPTLMRNVPGTSMYFGSFQAIKSILMATAGDRSFDRQIVRLEKARELQTQLGRNPFVLLHLDEDACDPTSASKSVATLDTLKKQQSGDLEKRFVHVHYSLSDLAHMMTGACARTLVGTLFMPITILKVRLESSQYKYTSIFDASTSIYREDGFRGTRWLNSNISDRK